MWRPRLLLASCLWLSCLALPALADQKDPRLPMLFERLEAASGTGEARAIEGMIWTIWGETKDPTSAMLLEEGSLALGSRAWQRALERLNQLVEREPDFAEGWNKRATLLYMMGDYAGSVADIQRTLALEPRHFGALSGLGLICMAEDRPKQAIAAFEQALRIYPRMPGATENLKALRAMLGGTEL